MAALMATLIVCLTLTISIAMVTAASSTVQFVFGDSLTDVGNNNFLQYSLAKSNYPWYGVDYINRQPTGRFTNGRTIGDIISAKLGIPSPPPYLSLSMNDDAILQGINFASGGAGILNETGVYFVQKLSFDDQITCLEKTKAAITLKIGEKAAEKLCNEAVYFIGLGSNDYVNNFMQPFLVDAQLYTHNEFLELLTLTLNGQLRRLYGLGARKVVFHGLGPLGCIPSQRVKSGTGECLEEANQYALEFNSRVKKLLVALNAKLPGAQMALADSYDIVLDLINNPERYGFKISKTSCCNVDTTVGGLCLPNSRLCSNRSEYVFWDAYHPTDAANAVIAGLLFADPDIRQAPSPVSELAPAPSPL
ncbi:GDSL esterase/lipase At5g37690 [Elaeis guineensis]|uniref:GDSL esterase/lipase At5g37690 n=1 Tax=Elaeis guineensis var. tenera TaxID=51953 RepID=A0A6I9QC57_ELAGV|nr:GDSL esterase/lipase At5g37690 [Elaeis guineensis]